MLNTVFADLAALAFAAAGIFNTAGRPAQIQSFVRWGYQAWWCRLIGVLEIAVAILIALPISRPVGLALGAIIIGGAALTLLRHKEFAHLVPVIIYIALLALTGITTQ